ncbi:translocation protein sec62 domain-containing protein [Ditylenchus destructor]|nr:translocation protein sec62 domain-containing protein [Ditylenchus destructor]
MRGRKVVWVQKILGNGWVRLAAFSVILLYHLPELGLMRKILLLLTGSISTILGIFITIHIVRFLLRLIPDWQWLCDDIEYGYRFQLLPNLTSPYHSFIESFKPLWAWRDEAVVSHTISCNSLDIL